MKAGDIITGEQANALPDNAVVRGIPGSGDDRCAAARRDGLWAFIGASRSGALMDPAGMWIEKLHARQYELLYLPAVPALKVGDVIETAAQADALPVGTVAVDDGERVPVCAPAIKVEDDRWLFHGVSRGAEYTDNETVFDHRILHIPARADTGAGSTAA